MEADSPEMNEGEEVWVLLQPDPHGFVIERVAPKGLFFILRTGPDALTMQLRHSGTLFCFRIQPVQYQRLYNSLWIRQVLRAIIFKSSEGFVVEAIRPLNRLGLWVRF
jgi:hypothetical protein